MTRWIRLMTQVPVSAGGVQCERHRLAAAQHGAIGVEGEIHRNGLVAAYELLATHSPEPHPSDSAHRCEFHRHAS
ncbi:hypothetical protein AB0L05_40770 [Nonomuraea pusilla]|uniref:hypothetical protein n=1 Tax=Nonomuraea pusilla TaxID=46177 RepID=UPI0033241EE0